MKRKDSILANFYYQSLPKAKEGGNYFQKYKVPENNKREYRVDPILKFAPGGETDSAMLPEVVVYSKTKKKPQENEKAVKASVPAVKVIKESPKEQVPLFFPKHSVKKFTQTNIPLGRKNISISDTPYYTNELGMGKPYYDVKPQEIKTSVPAAAYQNIDTPLINTGRKTNTSSANFLSELMARQAYMNTNDLNNEAAYISMLEQTNPEKAHLLKMMNQNIFKNKFFNGGFLMPAQEGGNINFPKERGYTPERMNMGGDISIPDLRKQTWITKYAPGGVTVGPDQPYHPITNPQGYRTGLSPMVSQAFQQQSSVPQSVAKTSGLDYAGGDPALKMRQQANDEIEQGRRRAEAKRTYVGPARATTIDDERKRIMKNQAYAATHPYAKIDEYGNLSRRQWDRNMQGVADKYTTAAGIDKGLEHFGTAAEIAGYVEGLGPLASLTKAAIKKGVAKSMESGLLSKSKNLVAPAQTGKQSFREMYRSVLSLEKPKESGLEFMNRWYGDPEIMDRYQMFRNPSPMVDKYGRYVNVGDQYTQADKLGIGRTLLRDYIPKTYKDLWKDKGWKKGLKETLTSSGVSYGTPESIYFSRGLFPKLGRIGQESTRAHELTHLINDNGLLFNSVENDVLLSPFGMTYDEYLATHGGYKSPSMNPLADNSAYHLDPSEIHSRMNEARFNLGLKPTDVFTPEHYKKIKKDHNWFGMGKYIKDPKRMVQLMNNFYTPAAGLLGAGTVGYNAIGNNTQEETSQQKYGGESWLGKYPTGGVTQSVASMPAPTPQTGSPNQQGPTFSNQAGYNPPDDKKRDLKEKLLSALGIGIFASSAFQDLSKLNDSNDSNDFDYGMGKTPILDNNKKKNQPNIAWNYNPNIQAQQIPGMQSSPNFGVSPTDPSMGMARHGGDVSIYGRRNYKSDTPSFFDNGGTTTTDDCPPGWVKDANGKCVQDPEARRAMAKKAVEIARKRIKEDKYYDVPQDLVRASEAQGEGAYGCIGGVCSVLTEAGVMKQPVWSNTDFALHAREYGFPNRGYGLDELRYLEPGDVLQYYDIGSKNLEKQYPHHSQLFLGINPESGKYEFFDNYNKSMRSYSKSKMEELFNPANVRNKKEYGRIYKVNPFDAPTPNPEAVKAMEERKKMLDWEKEHGVKYEYGIRKDSPYYEKQTPVMKKFIDWANNDENIQKLAEKTGFNKSIIHDELLNTFGELGAENKWSMHREGLNKSNLENTFEELLVAFGGGKKYSVGPGQIKFSTLSDDLKGKFEIKSPKDLYKLDKVIPLMTAINLQNRKWMQNKGEDLSSYLTGESGVGANDLKYGVGRWTPYMYRGSLKNPIKYVEDMGREAIDPYNYSMDYEAYKDFLNSDAYKQMVRDEQKLFEKGSYADKVYRNIDENLERKLIKEEDLAPVEVISKKKKQYGGTNINNWLNKYQS